MQILFQMGSKFLIFCHKSTSRWLRDLGTVTCDLWPVIHDPQPVTCGLDLLPNLCSYIICVRSSAETIRVLKNAILPFIRSWRYWLLALWPTGSVLVSAMGKTETCSTVMFLYYFPISIFWLSCVLILSYNYPVETFLQVW